MQLRVFGRTGMQVSVLGFGCGAVGGLMVRGEAADQARTVARAISAGVNYFDTAVLYGDGLSEKDLGGGWRERARVGGVPGPPRRTRELRRRQLLRHRGAVRRWPVGKEPWPGFATAE